MGGAAAIAEIARQASPEDFETLVILYRPRIFRFALASLRDRDAAESVTQDCFLRAHQAWSQFRGDSSVQTWLMKIAMNLIRDATKSQRFQFWKRAHATAILTDTDGRFIPSGGSSAEEQISAKQQMETVWKTMDRLSPGQRTVFLLHFMEEMDISEIEAITGISKATARVHLSRAVREVRNRLRMLK
jgi:RNA polymerase sigma-70 factor (ECF subfamily)